MEYLRLKISKLPCDQDLQACLAEGKLHAQAHTGRVG
jgi:hypothetical protein